MSAGDAIRGSAEKAYAASGGISQNSIIFGCAILGFFVYITCKNQLGAYLAVFLGPVGNNSNVTPAASNLSAVGSTSLGAPLQSITPLAPIQQLQILE